jgi:2-keto-4-pentenoate hydratase/2-oxohepta-3-ene-1,7-dioic acid hydratase in catechol pathway
MKFLTLEQGQLGALVGEVVVDLPEASNALGMALRPSSLAELLELGDDEAHAAWVVVERALEEGLASRAFSDARPVAPIPLPKRNIFCLGKNYGDHAKEMVGKVDKGGEIPEKPIIFTKATTSVIGPGMPIPSHPELTSMLDYEAELAIVLGKEGRDIPSDRAMEYVFGYTALNDVTARDLQIDHGQWFRGKSLDGFAPMGPVVVHRSVMPPPEEIEVKCWVNGEQRQRGTLADLIFDIPTIISILSAGFTLLAGDIIATGTPAGVGMGFSPPRYLQKGDEVTVEVTGTGRLNNRVA